MARRENRRAGNQRPGNYTSRTNTRRWAEEPGWRAGRAAGRTGRCGKRGVKVREEPKGDEKPLTDLCLMGKKRGA